jgi:hypothetical protein
MTSAINFDPVLHEYRNADGIKKPSVTWILAQSGLCDFSFVEDEIRERAMARGRSVHWMTRLEDEGALDYRRVPHKLRPFRKGYLGWKQASRFVPEIIEEPFISPLGFAGTPDRVGTLPPTAIYPLGSRAVVDLKTGSVYDWTRFQLCLYAVGVTKHIWQAKMLRRIGLALRSDGTYQVREFLLSTWDSDWAVAMEALRRTECLLQQ